MSLFIKNIIYNALFREKVTISGAPTLNNTVVLLTGASQGIGKATADLLIKKGANITLMSRHGNPQKNKNFLKVPGDVTSISDCRKAVQATIDAFGRIDALINNAGTYHDMEIDAVDEKNLNDMIDTNVKGVMYMTSAVVPTMKTSKKGVIINIGSYISRNNTIHSGRSVYAATKYAVEGFSKGIRSELAPYGIRVCTVMPSTVKTFRTAQPDQFISPHSIADLLSFALRHDTLLLEEIVISKLNGHI